MSARSSSPAAARSSPLPSERRPAASEPIPGAERERVVGPAQLGLVAGGLLEVVADELVQLDEGPLVLEPVGEAAVQVCANGLRESVVGGVADEQVAEAEAVLAGKLGTFGADQLVPDECREPWQHLRLVRRERLHGAAVEDLALDGAALEHARAPAASSWSSRAARSARSVGGTSTSPSSVASASISVMKSGLPARPVGDPPAQILRQRVVRSARPPRRARAARSLSGTGQDGRRSSSSGRAMHSEQQRRARREQSHRLDEVEERLLAPLQVVEADDERRLLLEQLAERPGDLVRARRTVALAEQRSHRGGGLLVGGQGVELLDTSTTGQ